MDTISKLCGEWMESEKWLVITSILLCGLCITILANLSRVLLILWKRYLRRVRFYIIANLAVTDIIYLLIMITTATNIIVNQGCTTYVDITRRGSVISAVISLASRFSSLFTAAFLASDRYIAVQYSSIYRTIMTKKKMIFIQAVIWFLSFTLSGMSWINVSEVFTYYRNRLITVALLRIIIYVLILMTSKYTSIKMKRLLNEIKGENGNLRISREKVEILQALKKSLDESFILYIVTAFVLLAETINRIVEMVLSNNFLVISQRNFIVKMVMGLVLNVIEVVALALSQGEIKKALKQTFSIPRRTRVEPL